MTLLAMLQAEKQIAKHLSALVEAVPGAQTSAGACPALYGNRRRALLVLLA